MDPTRCTCGSRGSRLPRTCGDGPLFCSMRRGVHDGSPAPAGDGPSPSRSAAPDQRLPRTCGDGPGTIRRPNTACWAPPHLRGWTLFCIMRRGVHDGSPAPAGMDLHRVDPPRPDQRLPRTCGDGPGTIRRPNTACWAPPHLRGWTPRREARRSRPLRLPAPAGMDPRRPSLARSYVGAPPHLRDGPMLMLGPMLERLAPPHLRGWTPSPPSSCCCP